jgi:hypothetical protein
MEYTDLKRYSIHLIEDENGNVIVFSDWTGAGFRALSLGNEIMESLHEIQPHTNDELTIELSILSNLEH